MARLAYHVVFEQFAAASQTRSARQNVLAAALNADLVADKMLVLRQVNFEDRILERSEYQRPPSLDYSGI